MDFPAYLLLGLATSLHCVAMCGTLVMTYSVRSGITGGLGQRIAPHVAYQVAKIASYMAVAVVLGTIAAVAGTLIDIAAVRNWVMVLAGAFMVLLGLSMTTYFPWLRRLTPRAPGWLKAALSRARRRASEDAEAGKVHLATPITFGLLSGLMPCAPLIAAQAGAMSSGSPVTAAVLMLGFGIGTAPLMIALGVASGFLTEALRKKMQMIAVVAVIVFGLVILDRGLMLVGSPVTFDALRREVVGTRGADAVAAPDSAGRIALVIENTRFVPDTVAIPADTPVEIVVDRREDNACSNQLAIPQLGVLADLAPFAKTTVKIPAAKAGTYTLTCGMGMMPGSLVVGGSGSVTAPRVALGVLVVVGFGTLAWAVAGIRRARRPRPEEAGDEPAADEAAPRLGYTWLEIVVVVLAIALAIAAGLYLGGASRSGG